MSGLSSILMTGLSAMRASQTSIGVASQNIANANTPGYVRTDVNLAPRSLSLGGGVEIASVRRAADRFLAAASYLAEAARGAAAARSDLLSRAQANFGDPNQGASVFATLDQFWSAMTELGVDPSSSLRRDDAVSALQTMYAEIQRVSSSIQSLIMEADQRIGDSVAEAQGLINQIAELNLEIRLTSHSGADVSASENAQSALIDKLSLIMDIRVSPQSEGGVHVRTSGGALLVSVGAAQLRYTPNNAEFATHGVIELNPDLGSQSNIEPFLLGGELKGLLQARDQDLPNLAEALGGFAASLADALNEVYNENSASPAIGNLVGRQTGLLGADAFNFTGSAIIGITDSSGALAQRLTIDFDAGTITGEAPAAVYNFNNTIDDFTTALDNALAAAAPAGSADFTGGVLSLSVGSSGGLVIQQAAADPSDRAGRGFSHFFGLNDLVSRPTPLFFESGVQGADLHGLGAGGTLNYQVRDSAGRLISEPTIVIAGALAGAGSTWGNLITALNASGTGLGGYGAVALDAATGRMSFTSASGFAVTLVSDSTVRGGTGVSMSALHGLSAAATAGRGLELDVNTLVAADPSRLAVGRPDLTADIGERIIEQGDNRGSTALLEARDTVRSFSAAGSLPGQTTTLATYSARLAGEAGRLAADSKRGADGAAAIAAAAADRRAQVESVSLDDELLKMTTYQNSYAAAARVIQAVTEMFDILLTVGLR